MGVLETCESHLWLGNLDITLRSNLFALLAKSSALLWHNRLSSLLLGQSLLTDMHIRLDDGDLRHSHSLSFNDAGLEGVVIDLLVEGWIVTALSVDVVSQKIMTIVDATDCRFDVALAVRVESWLAEVGCESAIWEPSRGIQEIGCTLFHLCGLLALSCSHLSLFGGSLTRGIVWIVHDCHSLTLSRGCDGVQELIFVQILWGGDSLTGHRILRI